MKNKVILITGATGGLGSAVTAAFLEAGAQVGAVSRTSSAQDTSTFQTILGDISNPEGASAAVASVKARFGRIDALVHLVGGFAGGSSILETPDATLDRMFDVNFRSALRMIQAVLPGMQEQMSGRIIAIGSRAAVEPATGIGVYAASKAALVSLIRTVALENKKKGITANVVLPGTMDTPANRTAMPAADFTRWVPPSQVARLLVHLVSDEASSINGAVLPIYGAEL